jgi:branched-chain amino acid transport system substrate-binding protein
MKKIFFVLSLLFLAIQPARADILWAVAGPFTGDISVWGLPAQASIKQAIADVNAAGGIGGRKIVARIYDDACDPKQAVAVANKIISENIHFAIHGSCSAASIAALKAYIDEGTVVMNPFASNPRITDEGGPDMFRTIYRDDKAALVIADFIVKHEANKKLVVLHDKSAYGLGIAQFVKDLINKEGVKEISFQAYDPSNHDYSTLVTHLKEMGTEAIFIGGYPVEIAMIARQLRDAGSKAQILAGDLSTPDFWRIAGGAGEGVLFSFPHDPRKEPTAKDVIDRLQKTGIAVDGYALYSYATVQVLAQAIAKAGSDDPSKVAAEIHRDSFKTILGPWTFDAKGDVNNIHQVMYRWHNGEFNEIAE